MTQVQGAKLTQGIVVGPDSNQASATKLSMFVLLVPGTDDGTADPSVRQSHVHTKIIRRR